MAARLRASDKRGFRALKIWMALKEHGVEKFGQLIDQDIAHADRLSAMIEAEPDLELGVPTNINIVCFRHKFTAADAAVLKALIAEIMLRLEEEGIACVSDTTVHGIVVCALRSTITARAPRTSTPWSARRCASADRSPGRRLLHDRRPKSKRRVRRGRMVERPRQAGRNTHCHFGFGRLCYRSGKSLAYSVVN